MRHRATHQDFGGRIQLHAGDELEVDLVENATTGFFWQSQIDVPAVIEQSESQYSLPLDSNALGAAGTHRFMFVARSEGTAHLRFELACAWRPGERPDSGAIEVDVGRGEESR